MGGKGDTLKGTFLEIGELPEKSTVTFSGVAATNSRLYVSDSLHERIQVYDAETMQPVTSWPFQKPGPLATDAAGNVWAISNSSPTLIESFTPDGTLRPQRVTSVPEAKSLAMDARGRLLVADAGPDQQVKIFDHLDTRPELAQTIGVKGGIYAGVRGSVAADKLNMPRGVGADAAGNVYVCTSGNGTEIKCFGPRGDVRWGLQGLEFVDCGDFSPDGQDVYTKEEHFRLNYSQPTGKEWQYTGYTEDQVRYPDDPRLHVSPTTAFVRDYKGRRLLYMTDMYAGYLAVYKLSNRDEIASPSVFFAKQHLNGGWPPNQPAKGRWIWTDANGNGGFDANEYDGDGADDPDQWAWCVDSRCDVWQGYLRNGKIARFRCEGLDKSGNPIYRRADSQTFAVPAPFAGPTPNVELHRLEYFPDVDTMYLSGFTPDNPNTHGNWKTTGPVICRYDHFSTGPKLRWTLTLPFDPDQERSKTFGTPVTLCVAGAYIFVGYLKDAEVRVYDVANGTYVTTLFPGPEIGSTSGWIDIPYGVRATRRANGEYEILAEDDARAKLILYRWKPGK